LRNRSHGADFWAALALLMPNYSASMEWLNKHQPTLSAGFLDFGVNRRPMREGS
jgi:predicted metal-dependent hydrolase